MAHSKDSDCPAVMNAVLRLSLAAKLDTRPCGQELCLGVDRGSKQGGGGRWAQQGALPWAQQGDDAAGGCQEPPRPWW